MNTVPNLQTHLREQLGFQGELIEIQGQYAGHLTVGFDSSLAGLAAISHFNEVVHAVLALDGAQFDCTNGSTLTKLVFNDEADRKERFTVTLTLSLVQHQITAIFS